jgi:uncharacterized protein (UPF0332 family)
MTYEDFVKENLGKGLLKTQKADAKAIEQSMARAYKDLRTARAILGIDEGIAYTTAYMAMLRAGRALMLAKGLRPADGYQHKTVVEFVAHALGSSVRNLADRFDKMRRKRNVFSYDVDVSISPTEARNAIVTAEKFVTVIINLLDKESSQGKLKL